MLFPVTGSLILFSIKLLVLTPSSIYMQNKHFFQDICSDCSLNFYFFQSGFNLLYRARLKHLCWEEYFHLSQL